MVACSSLCGVSAWLGQGRVSSGNTRAWPAVTITWSQLSLCMTLAVTTSPYHRSRDGGVTSAWQCHDSVSQSSEYPILWHCLVRLCIDSLMPRVNRTQLNWMYLRSQVSRSEITQIERGGWEYNKIRSAWDTFVMNDRGALWGVTSSDLGDMGTQWYLTHGPGLMAANNAASDNHAPALIGGRSVSALSIT